MRQVFGELVVTSHSLGLIEFTTDVTEFVSQAGIREGLLTLFCRHTSASLLVQENADPDVVTDLQKFFAEIVPEGSLYIHDSEGPDDMPAHIRAALTQSQLSIPLQAGLLVLGTWQGLYLFEHRRRPRPRSIALHLIGE